MKEKISIIIPIYNAEKNIKKCIESIICQTYDNIEIICINDGSTDKSTQIIENYQHKDTRITLINKENSGVSDTRNTGIKKSSGKYIMFIDADDYISKDYIEKMYEVIQKYNCDLLISGYTEVRDGKNKNKKFSKCREKELNITYPQYLEDYLLTNFFNSCWKQLINKKIITKNNIQFSSDIKYGEDMLFSFECYKYSSKTYYIDNCGYNYYINSESVMQRKSIEALLQYLKDNRQVSDIILNNNTLSKSDQAKLKYKTLKTTNDIFSKLIEYNYSYKECKENIAQEIEKYKNYFKGFSYFKYSSPKQKVTFILLKFKFIKLYYLLKNGRNK